MEVDVFLSVLKEKLNKLDFVKDFYISDQTETRIKIKVILYPKGFLNIYYNVYRRTQSFSLIINEYRVWGLDFDNRVGWHEHPVNSPNNHKSIKPHTIEQIVARLNQIWYNEI